MGKIRNLLLIALVGILSFLGGCGDVDAPKKPDTTAPSVLSLTPPQGATNVAVTSDMYATFSEPVSFSGVSLSFSGGNLPVVAEQPSQETIYLKLSPSRRLDYNTTYTASISGVKDSSGNSLGTVSWSFTTASPSFNTFTTPDSHNYDAGKYNSIATYGGKRYIVYQATSDCSLRIISTVDGSSFDGPYIIDNPAISGGCAGRYSSIVIDKENKFHVVYLAETQENQESIGIGDDTTKSFIKNFTYKPIKKGKIKIYLREPGYLLTKIGEDDGKGVIYDSNSSDSVTILNNSTIDYTSGTISLNLDNSVPSNYEIFAIYTPDIDGVKYATANNINGTWQKIRLHSFSEERTEKIADGDGSSQQFIRKLTFLPIMKGSVKIFLDGKEIGNDNGRGKIVNSNQNNQIDDSYSMIDYESGQIVLKFNNPPSYNSQIIVTYIQNDDINKISVGSATIFAAIATDNNSKVHISFYDFKNTALRYITNKNGLWQTVIVDDGETNDNPGMYTSIKVDNSGYVHISYYDYHSSIGNGNLKYVKGYIDASGNWKNVEGTPLTLDSTGDVGRYTSLTLYNDTPYITYYDGTNKKIKLMTKNASGDWEAQQIVSLSNESYLPLAIEESNGIMHLSYIENGNLYYLSKSLNWSTPVVVDTGIGNGVYSSIVVDSDGKVYISYYDATDKDLKYAHQKN